MSSTIRDGDRSAGGPSSVDGLKTNWDRFSQAMVYREYRPLWHFLSVLLIIVAACFLFQKNFPPHGTLMYTDMTWPNTLSRLQFNAANSWMPYGSVPIAGSQLWFYWIYPLAGVARLLHISASNYMFLMFLGTFSLAGISMYALAYSTIKSLKLPNTARYATYVGAVLAALIYMYNPWSLMYLREYFGYPIYALLPLLFLAMVKTFDSPSLKNIMLFSLFVVLVNTSHHLAWFWSLFISYFLFFIITNRFNKEALKKAVRVVGGTVVFYLLLGATWIMPYLGSQFASKPLTPFYSPSFSQISVQGLSANNTIMNNFRLVSFWAWTLDKVPGGVILEILVFTLPALAIISFLLMRKYIKRSRVINYWAAVGVLAILLTTGSSFILKRFYLYFTLRAPGSGSYGWMLRASERWLFFLPVFYALMIGILITYLLEKRPGGFRFRRNLPEDESIPTGTHAGKDLNQAPNSHLPQELSSAVWMAKIEQRMATQRFQRRLAAAVALFVLVVVSLYPVTLTLAKTIFNPADVPKDYQQVNDFLAKQADGGRVIWMPFYSMNAINYTWAPEKTIGPFAIASSNPSLSGIQEVSNTNSYYDWFESLYLKGQIRPVQFVNPELVLKKDEMSRLFAPFGAYYLIFDKSITGYDFGDSFETERSLNLVYETRYLRVYKADSNPGYISASTTSVKVNTFFDNLSVIQRLTNPQLQNLAFLDGSSYFGGASSIGKKYGVVDIDQYLIPLTLNGGFEEVASNNQPIGWYLPIQDNRNTSLEVVASTKTEGMRSLKVVNKSTTTYDVGWVTTWEEPVRTGDIYTFETNVKYRNAVWSYASIEGYQPSTGKWAKLINCPSLGYGDSNWHRYKCSMSVPQGFTKIRPVLGAGWVLDQSKGPAITWFDGVKLSKVNNDFISRITQNETPPRITYKKISAEEYRVHIQGATKPFVLTLSETYDGLWVANTKDGKTIKSVPMYTAINGFPIDKTGDFELTVRYQLQRWLSAGFIVSLLTILVCMVYLLYLWAMRYVTSPTDMWEWGRHLGGRISAFFEFPLRVRPSGSEKTKHIEMPVELTKIHSVSVKKRVQGLGGRMKDYFEFPPKK